MITRVSINSDLIKQVLQETGLKTKQEAAEKGLKLLLQLARQAKARESPNQLQS